VCAWQQPPGGGRVWWLCLSDFASVWDGRRGHEGVGPQCCGSWSSDGSRMVGWDKRHEDNQARGHLMCGANQESYEEV